MLNLEGLDFSMEFNYCTVLIYYAGDILKRTRRDDDDECEDGELINGICVDDELAQQLQTVQQQMSQQQFATALMSLELLLKSNPELQEALYMAAVCQRYQQQFVQAQDYLNQLFDLFDN